MKKGNLKCIEKMSYLGVGVSLGTVPVYHSTNLKLLDKRIKIADLVLRFMILGIGVVAAVLIGTDSQVKVFFSFEKEAKFSDVKALVFLVVANGLAAGYSLIQGLCCVVSLVRGSVLFNKPLAWAIFSADQVFFSFEKEAKFTDVKALVFLVVANGLAAGYSLIQGLRCVVSLVRGSVLFNKPLAWAIFSAEQFHKFSSFYTPTTAGNGSKTEERVIQTKGAYDSVLWVVQFSDLHFSVHHPDRAIDFHDLVGPALSFINPSLVLITGDLTDGKSKDLLTMKQNEDEWMEYKTVMDSVIQRSGIDKSLFFDLRGNHDNFGVPDVGGSFDFFSKLSISGQLGRTGSVNSVTLETPLRKHLFVGLDTTMLTGLRGPTNLFGHPTDQLLSDLDLELSRWDSQSEKPVTKIAFGHFPLSFSAPSGSGRTLEDVFLKHSISAYLCGHLHIKFGKNLKRHHLLGNQFLPFQKLFQTNMHRSSFGSTVNCSSEVPPIQEFWEWEMGDWRWNRAMRILAIDRGHVSFIDLNFKSGAKDVIILPTFPLDSRFMSTSLSHHNYECQNVALSSYETIRSLVFSDSPMVSVMARVYDLQSGSLVLVAEAKMNKHADEASRESLYVAPWNYKAYEDASPDRYWLQIEAKDNMDRSTFSELRPFSINGHNFEFSWSWKEFLVMGCQWAALYFPLFWSALYAMFFILLLPKALLVFPKKIYTYKNFLTNKGLISGVLWILQELCRVQTLWFCWVGYLFYLILFPWFMGYIFTEAKRKGYMTFRGWVIETSDRKGQHEYVGFPDIMVVVLPHLLFVVLPAILVTGALTAERAIYREHMLASSGKKKDDIDLNSRRCNRRTRKLLFVVCLVICTKHFMNCRTLTKAYDMNPVFHFMGYGVSIPLLLAYAIGKTRSA
ncbi:hypothetical protein Ahy_B04g073623 isoform F [Arachis hypogaea]|uniref:Calcineurin-like phosphoesterase domain-containing protein n=1 Tax=Arachis hypogaea TaxID=3818 RepID=A0A444ZQW3_ARAHY|nr:hypothetical protein Ahy_B04g073623 isoform F [Arachis hypogaea]